MAGLRRVGLKTALGLALAIPALMLVSGCDNGPSAVARKGGSQTANASGPASTYGSDRGGYDNGAPQVDHRKDAVAKADDGKPVWAASRKYSAEEGAQRQFERDGAAFQAKTLDQFVKKAHAFVGHPPKGTETLTRQNGDILFYDARDNIFAVASKEGAPRAMFKPDEGEAYWEKQKDREQHASRTRRSRQADAE